jgi:hypothetical protein
VQRLTSRLVAATLTCVILAGCAATSLPPTTPAGTAVIGHGASLVLPRPPGYPGRKSLSQSVIADARGRRMAFDAVLDLSPEAVEIAIAAPNGPRLGEISWNSEGVSPLDPKVVPKGLRSENLLADVYMMLWPKAQVESALRPAGEVRDLPGESGRTILVAGVPRVTIVTVPVVGGGTRTTLRNLDFHYSLTLISAPPG